MAPDLQRNLGEQPIARILREHNLKPHDLVAVSSVEMTHKMVARACKGSFAPIVVLIFLMGVLPQPFLQRMHGSVHHLIHQVQLDERLTQEPADDAAEATASREAMP